MSDVAIVGIGIHPFGRTEGVTGLQQGVHAAKDALGDAEIDWNDIQFAYGGSSAAGNADSMVAELGLTGIPFMNVANACATGGSALISAYTTFIKGIPVRPSSATIESALPAAEEPPYANWISFQSISASPRASFAA
jgi:hypothetical protein